MEDYAWGGSRFSIIDPFKLDTVQSELTIQVLTRFNELSSLLHRARKAGMDVSAEITIRLAPPRPPEEVVIEGGEITESGEEYPKADFTPRLPLPQLDRRDRV